MDATTPVNIPIRLEEWDGHDDIREVDTVVIDARPILDATEYDSLPSPADTALAVRLGERLRELQSNSDVLDRMFTGFSDRPPDGERADTGWAPPSSTAVMDDELRERMRRAIGAWTWQEFLDAVYKLGLFRED